MAYGYCGRILHVHLAEGAFSIEEPSLAFYRQYMGGSAMGMYYLLTCTPPGTPALDPGNTLCLMTGVITGAPISGQSRFTAVAKSPLTGLVGDSQAGGFWAVELKAAGFDGIVLHERAPCPQYLWIHDGEAELRDASALTGHFTADVEDAIRSELGDKRIQIVQCGPAAENGVLFGALIHHANRANGRTGMGTVMASKNLRAVAVRGRRPIALADPEAVRHLSKWGAAKLPDSELATLTRLGTPSVVLQQQEVGGLPTHNWQSGVFRGADDISGERMAETILTGSDTCYACVVRCKRVVEVRDGPFLVNPRYGGPEYETLATMGSYCGVSDLAAIARANQLCNMYGMDTMTCGATIAWAMDCYEHGLIDSQHPEGVELRFGNAKALVQMVELIGERRGLGLILSEGSARAAQALGVGQHLVVATKGVEFPAHMPQAKRSLALIYAVNPFGADHQSHEHDPSYEGAYADRMSELELFLAEPAHALSTEKVRFALYTQYLYSCLDSICACQFVYGPSFQLYSTAQLAELVGAVTGWSVGTWNLMKVGERRLNMMRLFNSREDVDARADCLPAKMYEPLRMGPTDGLAVDKREFEVARELYYAMAGWDAAGRPTRGKLCELGLEWAAG